MSGSLRDIELTINGRKLVGKVFKTFKMNTQPFQFTLKSQLIAREVKFVQKRFEKEDDLLGLKEELIFNCCGFGSKYLFKDKDMMPLKGHLIEYKNRNAQ